jgi:hypothetical protein
VARGVFAGSFVGFLPLPGVQFATAALLAWLMRGNILAAILGTFNSNPLTTPFFAVGAISLGHWMMGIDEPLSAEAIGEAFADAFRDLWRNALALTGPGEMHWEGLRQFWHVVYAPYFIGSLVPGLALSLLFYYVTIPLVAAYQKARAARHTENRARKLALRERIESLAPFEPVRDTKQGDDAAPPAP